MCYVTIKVHFTFARITPFIIGQIKHIDISLYWIKDVAVNGEVQIKKVHTADNPSYFLMNVVSWS